MREYVSLSVVFLAFGCNGGGGPSSPRAATSAPASVAPAASANAVKLDLPPRLQWEENYGYCGEVSFIAAGLYYGQYVSQWDARALASPGVDQTTAASQLLLGVNDQTAAAAMHLRASVWSGSGSQSFLAWVKAQVAGGYPTIMGVYMNQSVFNPGAGSAGDPDYDHIVPVFGIESSHAVSDPNYYPDDVFVFSDNGLDIGTGGSPVYSFSEAAQAFQLTRAQANLPTSPVYSIQDAGTNFGIAILGVTDPNAETVPVRVSTDLNDEHPDVSGNTRPAPEPLALTITVSGMTAGVAYNLYKYSSFASVPDRSFNANAAKAAKAWSVQTASGTSAVVTDQILSSDMAIYRAVPASGP